jgi:hypothetical protein
LASVCVWIARVSPKMAAAKRALPIVWMITRPIGELAGEIQGDVKASKQFEIANIQHRTRSTRKTVRTFGHVVGQ